MPDSSGRSTTFVDANVLLYLASGDQRRIAIVEDMLDSDCTVSVQVLNEIANVASRKMRHSAQETISFVGRFRSILTVVPVTEQIHERGLALRTRYNLSVYDAMIVAAALDADCTVLLSEDMHHGLKIDGSLEIRNPFR